jgi:hypothetical protein
MTEYQRVKQFNGGLYGVPVNHGIEYDFEIPDSQVVQSPGGLSSTHHHWSKGFYGVGRSTSDIYAGQGKRYENGDYGSMYNVGQTASQQLGYYGEDQSDPKYWQNQPPKQENFELIESVDLENNTTPIDSSRKVPWQYYLLLVITAIVVVLWVMAIVKLIEQRLRGGRQISYEHMFVIACVSFVLLVLAILCFKIPFPEFQ